MAALGERPPAEGEFLQRLLWPKTANPDRSPAYGEVEKTGGRFPFATRVKSA
jgi:hypothetical protein